jgi:2,3-dihydroxybiphenyl 1,2-dioxygenase
MAENAALTIRWVPVCPTPSLAPGQRASIDLPSGERCVVLNVEGELYAVTAKCTHRELSIEDGLVRQGCIICPWHRARFDLATGQALSLPARRPLRTFDVAVIDDVVHVREGENHGMNIHSIGYVGINATELSAWKSFATDILGVQVRDDSSSNQLLLKIDDHRWRIAIDRSDSDGFAYAGLELANAQALEVAVGELQQAGVDVQPATDEQLKARTVGGMVGIHDPAGARIELYYRPTLDYNFQSPRGARFVTGQQGFGHAVFLVTGDQYDACQEFYRDVLGFRVSEYTRLGPIEVCFLHCNPRHHSIALARAPITACQHIMLQVQDLDMVGCALDRAQNAGVTITSSLGRHRNDNMLSFYMRTPSGIDLEYGWGAREIDDDTWIVSDWEGGDVWGHRGIEALVND